MLPALKVISPRTRSVKVTSSSGIRTRSTGLPALGLERGELLVGQVAVEVVVAELGVAAGGVVAGLDFLRGGVALVGVAGLHELGDDVLVDVQALRLAVRLVRAAHLDALFPADAEPFQRLEQLLVALLGVARRVRVLDAEDEGALGVPRVGPVEQGGADQADVRGAGRRRAEPDPDRGLGGDFTGHFRGGGAGDGVGRRRSSHSGTNFTACPASDSAATNGQPHRGSTVRLSEIGAVSSAWSG